MKINEFVDDVGTQLDIVQPEDVQIVIRQDGTVIWINVDGICRLRICRISKLEVLDLRPKVSP